MTRILTPRTPLIVLAMVCLLGVAVITGDAVATGRKTYFAPAAVLVLPVLVLFILRRILPALCVWLLVSVVLPAAPANLFRVLYLAPIALIIAAAVIGAAMHRQHRARVADVFPAAFLVVDFISLKYGQLVPAPTTSLSSPTRDILVIDGIGIAVYYIVVFAPIGAQAIETLFVWLMRASILGSLFGLIDFLFHWQPFPDPSGFPTEVPRRAEGSLGSPAVLGAMAGIGVVLAIAVLMYGGPVRRRRLAWATIVVGLPTLFVTLTRGTIVAGICVALALLLYSRRSRLTTVLGLVIIGVALFVSWSDITSSTVYQNRVQSRANVDFRAEMATVSINGIKEHPIFGWGYDTFDTVKNRPELQPTGSLDTGIAQNTSHNTFLTIALERGLVGFAIYLAPFAILVIAACRRLMAGSFGPQGRWAVVGVLGALAVWEINVQDLDFRFFSYAMMLAFLLLAMLRVTLRQSG